MPSTFRSFTGLGVKGFDPLYSKVESRYDEEGRRADGGHPFKLSLRNRLLMLLIYYRLHVTSRLVSSLFDLDHSNVLRDMRMIEPVVREALPIPQKLHDGAKRASTPEGVEEHFPGFKAFIDAAEQEIPRPKSRRKGKGRYPGKRRGHTVKTRLTANVRGAITHRTPHARGRRHDHDIFKDGHPKLPNGVRPETDLGYYGVRNDFPELEPIIPFKKSRGQELEEEQKRFNKPLSEEGVVVEHTTALLKRFKVMGQEFRSGLRHYDIMTDIVSGPVNLRIMGTTAP